MKGGSDSSFVGIVIKGWIFWGKDTMSVSDKLYNVRNETMLTKNSTGTAYYTK